MLKTFLLFVAAFVIAMVLFDGVGFFILYGYLLIVLPWQLISRRRQPKRALDRERLRRQLGGAGAVERRNSS